MAFPLEIIINAKDNASGTLKSIAGNALGVFSGMNVLPAVFDAVGEATFGMNARMEQSKTAFTGMLGSGEKAQGFLDGLSKFAAKTPFEFEDLTDASKRMLAFGVSSENVLPLLEDVGNAAAAVGLGGEGINRINLALGQMKAKGKVSAEEMNQIAETGIPAWQMLADATGKPIPVLMDMASKGEITADTMINAFQQFSDKNYGGMMEAQSKTFSGAMSTIKDSATMTLAQAFKPLFDAVSGLAVQIATFVSSDEFTAWAQQVADAMANAGKWIGETVVPVLQQLVNDVGPGVTTLFQNIGTFITGTVVPALMEMWNWFGTNILPMLKDFGDKVGPVVSEIFDDIGSILTNTVIPAMTVLWN